MMVSCVQQMVVRMIQYYEQYLQEKTTNGRPIIPNKDVRIKPVELYTGHGVFDYARGMYTGDIQNGLPHGSGSMDYHRNVGTENFTFVQYNGHFADGMESGFGRITTRNDYDIEGPFADGHPSGMMKIIPPRALHRPYHIEANIFPTWKRHGRLVFTDRTFQGHLMVQTTNSHYRRTSSVIYFGSRPIQKEDDFFPFEGIMTYHHDGSTQTYHQGKKK